MFFLFFHRDFSYDHTCCGRAIVRWGAALPSLKAMRWLCRLVKHLCSFVVFFGWYGMVLLGFLVWFMGVVWVCWEVLKGWLGFCCVLWVFSVYSSVSVALCISFYELLCFS